MVTYLNERRDLWVACYPITDIWGKKARSRGGKLTLTSRDEIPERSKKLHQLFKWQTLRSGSPILVEKLPINNFRVSFLQAIFPDALFVHILRNGIEVARSIEREAGWYAKYNYRWDLIEEYAKSRPETRDLVDLCNTDYEKGLLEWRLSLDTFYSSTDMIDSDRILEITYDELMQDPMQTTSKILGFLKLPSDDNSLKFAENNLARRHPKVTGEFRNKEMEIAGTYLERWY